MSTVTAAPAATRSRAATIGLWVLQVLLGLMFVVGSGLPKLWGDAYAIQLFAELPGGQALRLVVGVLEIAGGIGLLVPRLAGLAATCLAAVMVGATIAQLFFLSVGFWYTPVILGVLLLVVAVVRRREIRALVGG
ncbi:DoxX family protein [Actinomycetospora soli]|uniref:DoxX family protein n=1 Tax=Actinomycetospora soli TaxID=2893887 RepID=UPI001E623E27|nr:DoxX family protein [Actinomycetospora soli]MCD2187114.1 DoxX family protein [Actinomycetospora soli]